ncbi:extracellular solute-binding protein [Pseudomonas chengduensis]|nr:extracellular solute-binding protein [Pseudomonas chengduensis]MDH0625146.1 extracellular solute-binding protein [Pseudomonas chengduensis]MDH1213395.1 extracellular solute-binding protein [Pseudomonas chengduensis]MDH1282808.1 extracellular solute-binding protein [Pseudomonas chengduensis]MDH1667345.1 extracellular solute-binding protein [Pseudomonas chengduensis]MDH1683642.1 extracellular solute-binding protein [Pseudomonas chengduensis]
MRLAATLLLLAVATPLMAEPKQLNLYNWADYVAPQALARFQAETGIRVKYDTFDSTDVLESKLMTGGSGYDLVFPASSGLSRAIQAKALQPVGELQNASNLDPELLAKLASVDPGNQYGVPYTWGTVGLAINKQAVEQRLPGVVLDSLDLLFKPEYASKLKDCGISVLDSPQEVIAIALNYLGKPPYSAKSADLEAASALLAALQPNLRYIGNARQIDDLAKGETCLALTYTGDAGMAAARAAEAGQPFEVLYRIPREGTLIWFDTMAIPADAPHPGNARAFIDFMLQPEAIAELTNELFFANANRAATALLDEAVSGDPDIYPPAVVRERLFAEEVLSLREQRQRTRLWTAFRTQY